MNIVALSETIFGKIQCISIILSLRRFYIIDRLGDSFLQQETVLLIQLAEVYFIELDPYEGRVKGNPLYDESEL